MNEKEVQRSSIGSKQQHKQYNTDLDFIIDCLLAINGEGLETQNV